MRSLRGQTPGVAWMFALASHCVGMLVASGGRADVSPRDRLEPSSRAHSTVIARDVEGPRLLGTGPVIYLDVARGTGTIARLLGGSVVQQVVTVTLGDSLDLSLPQAPPRDTIPARSRLDFRWHAEPGASGAPIVSYDYGPGPVDSSVHSVSFNTGLPSDAVNPGTKLFTLRATDSAGATTQIKRYFQMGYDPDTWFSGPDPDAIAIVPGSGGQRYVAISDWHNLQPIPGSLMSCDSLTQWPAARVPRKTFFEIYDQHLFIRAENDTVDMNSWVVFYNGGSDLDSPYHVWVAPGDPALAEDTVICVAAGVPNVVRVSGLNGSPIGFRFQYGEVLDGVIAATSVPSPSMLYPYFVPSSSPHLPTIAGYQPMTQSGRVYLVGRAVDSDGDVDESLLDVTHAIQLTNEVDSGLDGNPTHVALRNSRILTFYVNRAPYLHFEDPTSFPLPPEYNGGLVSQFTDRKLRLHLPASDPDPFDRAYRPWPFGGPTPTAVFRYTVTVTGKNASGRDTSYKAPEFFDPDRLIDLDTEAPYLVGHDLELSIELCDCTSCDNQPGTGRCVTYRIPVQVDTSTPTLASLIDAEASAGIVRLRWQVGRVGTWSVERRTAETGWIVVGEIVADGNGQTSYEDRAVVSGMRYGYRLVEHGGASQQAAGETWVTVPSGAEFSLEGVWPNPAATPIVSFSIPDAGPTVLEVFDVTGRRVGRQQLSLDVGRHVVRLGSDLPTGAHLVRLSHGGRVLTTTAVVLK